MEKRDASTQAPTFPFPKLHPLAAQEITLHTPLVSISKSNLKPYELFFMPIHLYTLTIRIGTNGEWTTLQVPNIPLRELLDGLTFVPPKGKGDGRRVVITTDRDHTITWIEWDVSLKTLLNHYEATDNARLTMHEDWMSEEEARLGGWNIFSHGKPS